MMCVFFRNSRSRASCPRPRRLQGTFQGLGTIRALVLVLALLLTLGSVVPVFAASPSTAPHTGMEGGSRHTYGPDGEGRKDNRIPQGGSPVDAYGNPIVTGEEAEEAPRVRPRPGAYGVRPLPPSSRPLPDLPSESRPSGWKFR